MTTKSGRPAYEPTDKDRATVKAMAGYGVPQEDIARVIDVSPHTLRKHFRAELDLAATQANAKVAETLFRRATDMEGGSPSVIAGIFWLKARAGWRETSKLEHTIKLDPNEMTDAQLATVVAFGGRKSES